MLQSGHGRRDRRTDRRTEWNQYTPPTTSLFRGYNYRPVGIFIVLSKVYERVMANQILAYFENIFKSLLSAFRKNYSCQSTLLNMVQHFKNSIDKGEYVGCIGMDFSKAFDCLPHHSTICKIWAYGASQSACTFLASYLCWKQCVKISNECSDWDVIMKGIQHGSILGPLISNIFLNDIFYFAKKLHNVWLHWW